MTALEAIKRSAELGHEMESSWFVRPHCKNCGARMTIAGNLGYGEATKYVCFYPPWRGVKIWWTEKVIRYFT